MKYSSLLYHLFRAKYHAPRPVILALTGALISSPSGSADLVECAQLPKPSVSIKRLEDALRFNTQYSYRSLTHIGGEKVKPGHQVLGLTRASAIAQFSLNMPSYRDAAERYECASPQISLNFGFKEMTVYVGKEFPVGSCAYKEIFEHEMRHVKAYQEHIAKVEKVVLEDLNRRFVTGDLWRGPAGVHYAQVSKELDERWLPYVNREMRKVDLDQMLIDTPEEYARLSQSCNGEVKNYAK
ncbi:MAG: hypothetical protein U0989_09325 [Azonexus sp.]|nr:hypothetical protein [Azonexus sp.]